MAIASGRRVRLGFEQKQTRSADELGNTTGDFAEVFVRHCRVTPRLGGEQVLAGRLAGKKLVNITVPRDYQTKTVTTEWRARNIVTEELFNIRSIINPDERGRDLEILAESGVRT